jgi:hypothetical protein
MILSQQNYPQAVPPLSDDRTFLALITGAGLLRVGMAIGIWMLAVLISNNPPLEVLAFRLRAVDSLGYNQEALHILATWSGTRDKYLETLTFSLAVAILYKIFGAHPLAVTIFSSICYAGVGLLAYAMACELGRSRWESRLLALAICLWPSSLVWSMAPIKEGPFLLAVFGLIFCLIRILGGRKLSTWKWVILGLGLLLSVYWLVFLRFYLWYLLWGMIPFILLYQLLPPGPNRARPGFKRITIFIVLLLVGLGLSSPFHQNNIIIINNVAKGKPMLGKDSERTFAFSLVNVAYAAEKKVDDAVNQAARQARRRAFEAMGLFEQLIWKLSHIRRGSVRQGGASLTPEALKGEDAVDLRDDFKTWQGALKSSLVLIKVGLRDIFLFPYPWEPWPEGRGWGPMQIAVAAQTLFWYLLMPGLAAGIIIGIRNRPADTLVLIYWCFALGLLLAITILNRGALFRLRDMAILPLLLLWHPWPYLRLWQLFKGRS